MKTSVLAENAAARSLNQYCLAEWGLSLFLEIDGVRILFDSGHKGTFLQNAKHMKVDINDTDFVVLSHHHWDHTGGLRFWEPSGKAKLITHSKTLTRMPADQSAEVSKKFDVTTTSDPVEFVPGIWFLGEIPRQTAFEKGTYQDDPMTDDSAIAIKTDKGVIVVTGCSHAGVCNIADYAKKVTGQQLRGVVGGFHLFGDDQAVIDGTIEYFKGEKPDFLFPMHCVDHVAMSEFYRNFKVPKYGAGDIFEI